jgi:eukaryotic-like serine/threonine-protein kinase
MEPTGVERLVGTTLAERYRLLSIVGHGAMGVVFRAHQLGVDREVAIKVLHPRLALDLEAVKRFEKEAKAISALRHPNTLRLYDCERTSAGEVFIVTELLTGRPLSELLEQAGHLGPKRATAIVDQICRSLGEAHAAGIVHRDLKPENVFLDRVGGEEVVKVLDFGIAKMINPQATASTTVGIKGTPRYMSPEQANSEVVDERSDIYSVGVMLYEMIAGRPPFDNKSIMALLHAHIYEQPPPFEESVRVPPNLERLIFDMLAKSPKQRPASVDEVRARLIGHGEDVAATRVVDRMESPSRRPWVIGAVALAVVVLAAAWFAVPKEPPPSPKIESPIEAVIEAPAAPAVVADPVIATPPKNKARAKKKRSNGLLPVDLD